MMKGLICFLLLAGASAQAQLLSNGPFATHAGAFAACAPPGDASALETNLPVAHTAFGFAASGAARIADEFTVPPHASWTLNSFRVFAYQTGSSTLSTITGANYRIWSGPPGDGGVVLHDFSGGNQLISTSWTGVYRAALAGLGNCANTNRPVMDALMQGNGLVLGPGTYWLDFQLSGSLPGTVWTPPVTVPNVPQTGNARQDAGAGWQWVASGGADPSVHQQGIPFEVQYACQPLYAPLFPVQPIPYGPGTSYGPFAGPPDPVLEADQGAYAAAYWEMVDTCGAVSSLAANFAPQSPGWPTWTPSSGPPTDPDAFAEGVILFRHIFSHRLQLDPSSGPLFDVDELIASDPVVSQQWRWWTLTRQLVTAEFIDPAAHLNHILALVDAFLQGGSEWETRGVPFFDAVLCVVASEGTVKRIGNAPAPPAPVNVGNLPANVQNCDASIRQRGVRLANIQGLYEADGSWFLGHVGFDCDDFADAIGSYVKKGVEGMSATTLRVSWTNPQGQGAAHRVTKIRYLGYYWIVDAQTGSVNGPHEDGTAVDARPVLGGYNVDNNRAVVTTDDRRALGSRPGLREPPAWFTSAAQRNRFQNFTGLDPDCFRE